MLMRGTQNTPELWNRFWEHASTDDPHWLERERRSIRWQRIHHRVLARWGSYKSLEVIEIGAGSGTHAALMSQEGARVTVLDFSDRALEQARTYFMKKDVQADFVLANALELPVELKGRFDISMSFGLAEHFRGRNREQIVRAHIDVLKPGGVTFISVPNTYNLPYRFYRFLSPRLKLWKVGEEYPFSRSELRRLVSGSDLEDVEFFGDAFWDSFRFLNPVKAVRMLLKKPAKGFAPLPPAGKGTVLDGYVSYALVLYGTKRHRAGS